MIVRVAILTAGLNSSMVVLEIFLITKSIAIDTMDLEELEKIDKRIDRNHKTILALLATFMVAQAIAFAIKHWGWPLDWF